MEEMAKETIRERFGIVLRGLGITPYQLAREAGDKPIRIYNILNDKARPSHDPLEQYPQINLNWLVSGAGEMFKGEAADSTATEKVALPFARYPFVSIRGEASFVKQYGGLQL
jgi:hypothetical protein